MRNADFAGWKNNNETVYSRIGFYIVRLEEHNLLTGSICDEEHFEEAIDVMRCWYNEISEASSDEGTELLRVYEKTVFSEFMRMFGLMLDDIDEA